MTRDIRLLLIGPLPPPVGGVAEVYRILKESGLGDHFILRILDMADRSKNALCTQGRFSIGNAFLGLWHLLKLFLILLSFRPNLIYMTLSSTDWALRRDSLFIRLATLFNGKVVLRIDNSNFRLFYNSISANRKKKIESVFTVTSSIHVLGNNIKNSLIDIITGEKIKIIANGVEVEPFTGTYENREIKLPSYNVLYMGWLTLDKGVMTLIDAFDVVSDVVDNAHLYLAGPWVKTDEKELIMRRVEISPHADKIHLLGVISSTDKSEAFKNADIFAMPTYHPEGQPIVLIEALAAGLPIITCDVGDVTSILHHGRGGYIVPANDPLTLANRLIYMRYNKYIRIIYGKYNRDLFESNFTSERFVESVISDLRRVSASVAK